MNGIKIRGTGRCVPENVVTNQDLAKSVETSDEWITTRTGIQHRHHSTTESHADLCLPAAKRALEKAGVAPAEIGAVIVATVTPGTACPSAACLLQRDLGLPQDIPCFDLNAACTGFLFALHTMECLLNASPRKFGLVVGAEQLSRVINWEDRNTCILFGDGAGAAVVQADDETGILFSEIASDGAYSTLLSLRNPVRGRPDDTDYYLHMKGNEVFRFAVNTLSRLVVDTVQKAGFREEDLDWLVPHQANLRIISATAKKLKMDMDRVIVTLDRHGNTSAGSVALALDEGIRDGRIKKGNLLLLEAFGSGFTWGSVLLRY